MAPQKLYLLHFCHCGLVSQSLYLQGMPQRVQYGRWKFLEFAIFGKINIGKIFY